MATTALAPGLTGRPGLIPRPGLTPRPVVLCLTRRGRLVLRSGGLLLLVGLLVGAVALTLLVASRPAQAGTAASIPPMRYHLVLPGETLWSIAGALVPGGDPRDAIVEIERLNRLPGSGVVVGQRLALPAPG
jgi:LysM domain